MGVDYEITKINEAIYKVFAVIYRMNYELNDTLQSLNSTLGNVDEKINLAVAHVDRVEEDVVKIAQNFPLKATYYVVLIILIVLLNLLSLYLGYYIYRAVVEMEFRSDKIVRKFNKKFYSPLPDDRNRFLVEEAETPPPTYDEYVKTADLYVKYHSNASHGFLSSTVRENEEEVL